MDVGTGVAVGAAVSVGIAVDVGGGVNEVGVGVGTGVAVGAAVNVGTAVDVGGGVDVGVGDPSHPANISASVTPLTSPRVQNQILLDLNTITSFAIIGCWVDQLLMTLVTYISFSALAPKGWVAISAM